MTIKNKETKKNHQARYKESITEAIMEAEENKVAEIVKSMRAKGLSEELIAEVTGLKVDQVKAVDADTTTTD